MVEQKIRRHRGFQAGTWVEMGDGQRWMFPHPPSPGVDREYDGLIGCLREAEDMEDARRIELALGIRLLSRNYDPQPSEYEAIFSFGANEAARASAQAAISDLIYSDLEKRPVQRRPVQSPNVPTCTGVSALRTLFNCYAGRFRMTMAPRVHLASPKRPSCSRKLP